MKTEKEIKKLKEVPDSCRKLALKIKRKLCVGDHTIFATGLLVHSYATECSSVDLRWTDYETVSLRSQKCLYKKPQCADSRRSLCAIVYNTGC
jgi:hypothetical protein